MAVSISDIAGLEDKKVYETSNEKMILIQDYQKIVYSPEYKILGFLNGYMYISTGTYIQKCTLEGIDIADLILEVEHAVFHEGLKFFYAYIDNILYKVNENLVVEWTKTFQNVIREINVDLKGNVYVIFESSRDIYKYLPDGSDLIYISGSDDVSKSVYLYSSFISTGGGFLYVIGSEYWGFDKRVSSFIDKYNGRTWERVERVEIASSLNVEEEDEDYVYDKFYVKGDYIYIYAPHFLKKINLRGIESWSHVMGYNALTGTFDTIADIEYDDNTYDEILYFEEDLFSTNGHSFGKMTTTGKILWKLTLEDSIENIDFRLCIYRDKLYTTDRSYITDGEGGGGGLGSTKGPTLLAVNNDRVLFRTTANSRFIWIKEYLDKELYSPETFYGYYLLADEIREDVSPVVDYKLMSDDVVVVLEDDGPICLSEENPHYNDKDNYEYKYLVSSRYTLDPSEITAIFTKNYKPLFTKLKNVIKTKEPYLPDTVHEFILNMEGNRIDSMQNEALVRARNLYSIDRYLLASQNMFFTDIVAKDKELTIVTKADGWDIIRKVREVYSYTLSRYGDMDLIEEWLKQNGILDTKLPEYVAELASHTLDAIRDISIAGIPVLYDIHPYKQFEYTFDGTEYVNNTWGTQIFSCTNLPFDKRRCNKKVFIDSLAHVIERQEMRPVLFFLNNRAVKWSDCTIVKDWAYAYVIIKNTDVTHNDLRCIMFPCDIRYGEDNKCLTEDVCNTYFYFDSNGAYTADRSKVAIRVEVIDKNVIGETLTYNKGYIEVKNEYKQRAFDYNIFAFENNLYFPDSKFYIHDHGKDIFTYLRPTKNVIFKTFYYVKTQDYYGTLYKIPNSQYSKDAIITEAKGASTTAVDNFRAPFSFTMSRKRSYLVNVAKAVEYIMSYDMSLLIKYYKDQSKIASYVFDGADLLDRVPKDGGWLIMPRHRKGKYDDHIIVFRNNHLYEWYKGIVYENHNFKIPIFDHIHKEDKIEILHFKEVDNSYYSLTVDRFKMDYLPEGLRYDNFLLFGNSYSGKAVYDQFTVETSNYYELNFKYRNHFLPNGKYNGTEIRLKDSYYENKSINVCSKRQFQYMYYNIFYDRDEVSLSPDFKFCHDKTKFLIFHNWKLVPQERFELHLMTNEYHRKYIDIHFTYTLKEGDGLDIFYLPMSYTEIDISDDIDMSMYNTTGDILMDMSKVGYQFDKDIFLLSVDGYKVNYSLIENIDNHRCRVISDPTVDDPVVNNKGGFKPILLSATKPRWTLYQFIQPDELLGKLFSYSDYWSDAVDQLTPEMYRKLLIEKTKA